MEKMILIADDNEGIIDILKAYLNKEGWQTVVANDGIETIEKFRIFNPVLILLDVMMPKKDGFQVCKEIRAESNIPIIMITAKGEDADKILGLDIGADDYIVKPFSPSEVLARVRAILRRIEVPSDLNDSIISFPGLQVNINEYEVVSFNEKVNLTKKEIDILWLLISNPGKVFSRDNLLNSIWGYEYYGDARTVDTHIKRLRAKLGIKDDGSWDIKTIWGVGYKFEVSYV